MTTSSLPKCVAMALSGGVDSAVAAHLLKQRGFNVIGVFMQNWDVGVDERDGGTGGVCHVIRDMKDAEWAADKLGIEFRVVSFVKEYWNDVFTYVMNEYAKGRTPNGDMLCNQKIKFDVFMKFARESLAADAVATGHYVRSTAGAFLERLDDQPIKLLRGSDVSKDQSFFLSRVNQKALSLAMFPLGSYQKKDVKSIARSVGLGRLAEKEESMGVCFVGARNFHRFILDFIPPSPGPIRRLEPPGEVLGEHHGVHTLTVGQGLKRRDGNWRKSYRRSRSGKYFVAERCAETNTVFVVEETDHPALYSDSLIVEDLHWISDRGHRDYVVDNDDDGDDKIFDGVTEDNCNFQGRPLIDFQYNNSVPVTEPCALRKMKNLDYHRARLKNPFRAITPGQFAVFYRGVELLGSGKTVRPGPSLYDGQMRTAKTIA